MSASSSVEKLDGDTVSSNRGTQCSWSKISTEEDPDEPGRLDAAFVDKSRQDSVNQFDFSNFARKKPMQSFPSSAGGSNRFTNALDSSFKPYPGNP